MVSNLLNECPVCHRNLAEMRRVNDEFYTVSHYGFKLIRSLCCHPEFVVHGGGARKNAPKRTSEEFHVDGGREVCCRRPCFFGRPAIESKEALSAYDEAHAQSLRRQKGSSGIDDGPDRRAFPPNDDRARHESAEPVEHVDNVLTRNTRKEVFVSARESDDFVRKGRTDDQDDIVLHHEAIDGDIDRFVQESV